MYLKYKNDYPFINYDLQMKICTVFKTTEKIHQLNKKNFESKKKFLNYSYILYKIFEKLNLGFKYTDLLDLPNNVKKLDNYYNDFFNY